MANPTAVVRSYLDAVVGRDWPTMRASLADVLSFRGPFDRFDTPEPMVRTLQGLYSALTAIDIDTIVSDGADVFVLYQMTVTGVVGPQPIAGLFHVSGARIDTIRLLFDPRPFAPLFPPHEGTRKG